MKVRELIEHLRRLDPEMVVVMPLEVTGDYGPIPRVGVDTVGVIGDSMTLSYPYEEGAVEVVRLFDSDLDGQQAEPSTILLPEAG